MKSFYINLDNDAARRDSIEGSFARHNKAGWTLERFPAFDADYVKAHKVDGTLRDEEKACFLSHRNLITKNADADQHIFVMEDDVCFAQMTFQTIDGLLRPPTALVEWDLLYTEVGVFSVGPMAELVRLRRELLSKQQIKLLDLKNLSFFGSNAYIVNRSSLGKLNRLTSADRLDMPFDLLLRKLIYEGALKAFVTFPFLTSLSEHSSNSTQQPTDASKTALVWDVFRRMIWIEGDSFDPTASLELICEGVEERSNAYGRLWAVMTDPRFQPK